MELKPRFKAVYLEEARNFLMRVDAKTRDKIAENIETARFTLDPQLLKKLTGDVWEFRALYQGKQYRMLAFWDKRDGSNTLVIATHGFVKKTSKIPAKEVQKAKAIMTRYFNY